MGFAALNRILRHREQRAPIAVWVERLAKPIDPDVLMMNGQ
jgi:hypothetical protein